jgi:pimeloyl-ACP methyl ester carboxylesterase
MATPTEAPNWFLRAVAQTAMECIAPHPEGAIAYRCWNPQDRHKSPLLLAHGYRAHAHWWDAVAPFLTESFRVYALDFSGMGDSAWRIHYDEIVFTENILTVLDHAEIDRAILVGHSYGGTRVLRGCADFPHRIAHAIILDSYINFLDSDIPPIKRTYGSPHPFPDMQSGLARYRLLPEQPGEAFVREHVARHSLTQEKAGWRWKFDLSLPFAMFELDGASQLAKITVPVDIVCGELSQVLTPARAQRIVDSLSASSRVRGPIVMPATHHHIMIDQPLALIGVLRSLLS